MRIPTLRIAAVTLLLAVVAGCATMTAGMSHLAGIGVISTHHETFDDSTTVNLSPAYLYDPASALGNGIRLGATWSSTHPDLVALVFAYDSNVNVGSAAYANIRAVDINIDGAVSSYSAGVPTTFSSGTYNQVTNTIYTHSSNVFVIPLSTLQAMMRARDCRLRVHTNAGEEDAVFSIARIPGGMETAIVPMREFLDKVATVETQR